MAVRTAILISGRGSNMAALIEASQREGYPAEIALVGSNNPDAAGLAFAAERGVPTKVVNHRDFEGRGEFEARLDQVLKEARIELVCLAGFMLLLGAAFVEEWKNHLINIHPSLLPAFKGLKTHERALAAGVRIHGATVHFVRDAMDEGPIIAQAAVPVLEGDTPETLAKRVLAEEHRIYPAALAWLATRRARVVSERVVIGRDGEEEARLISPAID
jgi:phosphoribosylglycinamide formyltransferase 1